MVQPDLDALLRHALLTGDDAGLRSALVTGGIELLAPFARAVGALVVRPDPPVEALEALLDGWAALPASAVPDDAPEVVLPCAAVAAYGEVGAVRPDWRHDEVAKLRRATGDDRPRVREIAALALRRLLDADRDLTS